MAHYSLPDAGDYLHFPCYAEFSTGSRIVVARKAASHVGAGDYGILTRYYSNDGVTWSAAVAVLDESASYIDLRSGAMGVGTSDRLCLFYVRYDPNGDDWLGINSMYSDDYGATWSEPAAVDIGTMTGFTPYGHIIVNDAGHLLAAWYGGDGTANNVYVLKSTNNGAAWGSQVTVLSSATSQYNEADFVNVGSDALIGLVRIETAAGLYEQVVSINGGATWATVGRTRFDSATYASPISLAFAGGTVSCYYTSGDSGTQRVYVTTAAASDLLTSAAAWNVGAPVGYMRGRYPSVVQDDDGRTRGVIGIELTTAHATVTYFDTLAPPASPARPHGMI